MSSVHDGDTIRCSDGRRVRLLLIDAPELDQPPFGAVARDVLRALIPVGAVVDLEYDIQRKDRYRRDLAYVFLSDGRMANEEIVKAGYAVVAVYPPNVKYVERLRAAAAAARAAAAGMWATPQFGCKPDEHRAGKC